MKTKRKLLNIHTTPKDIAVVNKLREKHAINISGMFKIFLYYLEQELEKIDYKSGVKQAIKNEK
jgi:hypothetical protein